eukprot:scaffold8957_cov85-Cylindrotheca_fusiformis.AAC.1
MDDRIANPSSEFGLSSITGFWFGFVASNSKILQRDADVDDWNHKQSEERFQVIEPPSLYGSIVRHETKASLSWDVSTMPIENGRNTGRIGCKKNEWHGKSALGKMEEPLMKQIEGKSHPTVTIRLTKLWNEGWLSSFFC